jgi:hypothetical protein
VQENVSSVDNGGGIYPQTGAGYSDGQNGYVAYPQHQPLEGCMYMNEHGHMCGPYAPKQLYEGLSTGFLPQDLAIYALVGGKMVNPVPLSLLEQFLSQWNSAAAVSTPNESNENKTVARADKMALRDVCHASLTISLHIVQPLVYLPDLCFFFCFLTRLFQVMNHAGCSRMQTVPGMGLILLLNFLIGIIVAISRIFQW